ncbi:hypothetical protein B0181_02090 [Moraxella caviae]|uniref:HicB-like antitoxin of toxin-antitoxin system domain-containing protein n=1 Tax=Moraxella caviae TaxID=34060 RepID=A0A1T0A8L9_9GAMM|nr:type II toxin-antitoxin system HicB family antitoxin [Moraxella caviae]OOR92092.1 hypothetical protein B0181_02090 [Moraxella caviae]STZ14448.1 Uncharacterised protein [Moraxella caviae]VEW10465.1 Uncharacterised protein [Moraxella caviae]
MKPNAQTHYNPDPDYLRELVAITGLSQNQIAKLCGVGNRAMRSYLTFTDSQSYQKAPYAVQFCLECLAQANHSLNTQTLDTNLTTKTKMLHLPIAITKDEGMANYGSVVPDVPGCYGFGESLDELLNEHNRW